MRKHRGWYAVLFATALMFAGSTEINAQSVDPAEMIQRSARTRVATNRKVQRPPLPAPGKIVASDAAIRKPLPAAQGPISSALVSAQPAEMPVQQRVTAQQIEEPSAGSGFSTLVIGATVLISLAGTIGLLQFVNRILQRRTRMQRTPSVIAPIPFAPHEPVPTPVQKTIESLRVHEARDEEEPSEMLEEAQRYQRGRGEMELALAIENLKRGLPSAPKRKVAIPKSKKARITAARKMGTGSGELELAMRLEKLRAASRIAEDRA